MYVSVRDGMAGEALSPREVQVLELVAEGQTNIEIARDLHIEYQSVKNCLYNAYGKLGVNTRLDAVLVLMEDRTLPFPDPRLN